MAPQEDTAPGATGTDLHRLARLLRHEVGDLLQSVYSTVGLLVERLPPELKLERRLLTELKSRAEVCKLELNGVVDLVAPLSLTPAPMDLQATVHSALLQARQRFPALQVDGALKSLARDCPCKRTDHARDTLGYVAPE